MAAPAYITGSVPSASEVDAWMINNQYVIKTADESVSASTTLQDDNHLTLPVVASSHYLLNMLLAIDGPTAADFKFQLVGPAGAIFYGAALSHPTGAADTLTPRYDRMSLTNPLGYGTLGVGVPSMVSVNGIMTISTTAGTVTMQWAQNTSNGTAVRVLTGSYLDMVRKA